VTGKPGKAAKKHDEISNSNELTNRNKTVYEHVYSPMVVKTDNVKTDR